MRIEPRVSASPTNESGAVHAPPCHPKPSHRAAPQCHSTPPQQPRTKPPLHTAILPTGSQAPNRHHTAILPIGSHVPNRHPHCSPTDAKPGTKPPSTVLFYQQQATHHTAIHKAILPTASQITKQLSTVLSYRHQVQALNRHPQCCPADRKPSTKPFTALPRGSQVPSPHPR